MTTTLRTLLSELDRPDLPDAAKQVVQLEIEKLLGRNAREILRVMPSDGEKHPPILDACCGSRMFWFDRKNPKAIFVDRRAENHILCDGRKLEIAPDTIADFTDLPFPDETFYLIVFDPPHMTTLGENSWMAKKYGRLTGDWKDMLRAGFAECFRVLKKNGTLVFKWNESDVSIKDVLELTLMKPMFGHTSGRHSKTMWVTFFKHETQTTLPAPHPHHPPL